MDMSTLPIWQVLYDIMSEGYKTLRSDGANGDSECARHEEPDRPTQTLPIDTMASKTRSNVESATLRENNASSTARVPLSRPASPITEPPPPYEDSAASTSAQNRASTQRQSNNRAHKSNTWTQNRAMVSTLPADRPTSGYTYIGDSENTSIPESEGTKSDLRRKYQRLGSRMYAHIAEKIWNRTTVPAFFHYYDGLGRKIPFSLVDGIQPGEIERPIRTDYDWTLDWDWMLTMQWAPRRDEKWRTWAFIYLNDLSDLLRETIPWDDAQRINSDLPATYDDSYKYKYGRNWRFSEPVDNPRWGASVCVDHNDYSCLMRIDDPWPFLTSDSLIASEVDQRTGAGKFKKVMWYYNALGYGNDILDQPVESWKAAHAEQFAEFISRLMPYRP